MPTGCRAGGAGAACWGGWGGPSRSCGRSRGRCSSAGPTLPSPSPDSRFLAVRFAAQDATDFGMADGAVHRFIELRDAGAGEEAIAEELRVPAEVVAELVRADDAQALAHPIAEGEEPV